jgi:monoamine oxidase
MEDTGCPGARAGARFIAWAMMLTLLPAGCASVGRQPEKPRYAEVPAVTDCGKTTGYDVIIVGAGLSGLTAARELRRGQRSNILILEATDRIGGRARTLKEGPPIDLGGAWLHGVPTNPLTGIVDAMGFARVRTHLDGPVFIDDGIRKPTSNKERNAQFNEEADAFGEATAESARRQQSLRACQKAASGSKGTHPDPVCDALEKVEAEGRDKVSAYLPQESVFKFLLAGNAGPLESSTEIDKSSTVDVGNFEAEDDDLLAQGMGTFVEAYGRDQPVCLNSPVTKITYRENGVVVEVKGGKRYEARKVLVTVSTGVLKAGRIHFDPELPARKRDAINALPMGNMQKVIIDLKSEEDFFAGTPDNSWVLYQSPPPNNDVMAFVIKPLGKNIAIGFYGGVQAESFEGKCAQVAYPMGDKPLSPVRHPCDEEAVQRARAALGRMYGSTTFDIISAIDKADIYVTRWSLDPWTYGAYSAAQPGNWFMREELAKAISYYEVNPRTQKEEARGPHRVYFAGEACSRPMYNGSFAGAYESGVKAARAMLDALLEEAPCTGDCSATGQDAARVGQTVH